MDTYLVTIDGEEYEVQADSPEDAQSKARAAHSNASGPLSPELADTLAKPGATISPTPRFSQDMYIPGMGKLPISPEGLTDLLPGLGGTLGAFAGPYAPAAIPALAGAGESVRMAIRKAMGYAPATGVTQELFDLDPNAPSTMLANVAAEAAGAGLMSKIPTPDPAKLRQKGLEDFAKILVKPGAKRTEAVLAKTVERITPIADDLPVGTRGRLGRIAGEEGDKAGEALAKVYDKPDIPASVAGPKQSIYDEMAKLERTPGYEMPIYDSDGNIIDVLQIPPDVSDPALYKALQERAQDMQRMAGRREAGVEAGVARPLSLADQFSQRKTESELAKRAKAEAFNPAVPESANSPKVQAHKAAQRAWSDDMHATVGEAGVQADALHTAWRTVQEGATRPENEITNRWLAARTIPGRTGTVVGALLSKPAIWRSASSKAKLRLASLIESGDLTGAEQLARALLDTAAQPDSNISEENPAY